MTNGVLVFSDFSIIWKINVFLLHNYDRLERRLCTSVSRMSDPNKYTFIANGAARKFGVAVKRPCSMTASSGLMGSSSQPATQMRSLRVQGKMEVFASLWKSRADWPTIEIWIINALNNCKVLVLYSCPTQ